MVLIVPPQVMEEMPPLVQVVEEEVREPQVEVGGRAETE
jgi:hypothetical protein